MVSGILIPEFSQVHNRPRSAALRHRRPVGPDGAVLLSALAAKELRHADADPPAAHARRFARRPAP